MVFKEELVNLLPQLRGYALGLTRRSADADDLVQDTVMRALASEARFAGGNMRAWLFTILRNQFYDRRRDDKGHVSADDIPEYFVSVPATQEWGLHHANLRKAVLQLSPNLREVLLLSLDSEMTYSEIGQILGCQAGAVKSRVFRARRELAAMLNGAPPTYRPPTYQFAGAAD